MAERIESLHLLSRKHRRAIAVSVLLAGLLYLVGMEFVGRDAVLDAMSRLGWAGWGLVLACSLANYLLRFWRWHYYVRQSGVRMAPHRHIVYYLAGFALTTTPGKAGETIRSVFLRPHGVAYRHSLACFFVERFMDVLVVAGLSVLTILAVERHTPLVLAYTLVIVALVPAIRSRTLRAALRRVQQRLSGTRGKRFIQQLLELLQLVGHLLSLRWLYFGFAIGLIAWSIQGIAFYSIAAAMGFSPGLAVLMGVYAISLLAGAASFVPGGLGTTEAAMVTLLVVLGAEAQTAWAIAITSRVSTLWFAVALGLAANMLISVQRDARPAPDNPAGT